MAKKFNIDGNLQVTEKIIVKDLEVQGTTQTVNQETLTIKDNIIAVNGDATSLETAGMAGIIAATGGENINLKKDRYYIDTKKLGKVLDVENYYNNHPTEGFTNFVSDKFNSVFASVGFSLYGDGDSINIKQTVGIMSQDYTVVNNSNGNFAYGANIILDFSGLYAEPLIVASQSDVEFLKSFLLDSNQQSITSAHFETKGQAYAAPIYDKTEDTLKIGLGNFEKDGNGNVIKFEFGAGQGQSILTRSDDITTLTLLQYNPTKNTAEGVKNLDITPPEWTGGNGTNISLSNKNQCLELESQRVSVSDFANQKATSLRSNCLQHISLMSGYSVDYIFPEDEIGGLTSNKSVSIATREWVQENIGGGSGGSLYVHNVSISAYQGIEGRNDPYYYSISVRILSSRAEAYQTLNDLSTVMEPLVILHGTYDRIDYGGIDPREYLYFTKVEIDPFDHVLMTSEITEEMKVLFLDSGTTITVSDNYIMEL